MTETGKPQTPPEDLVHTMRRMTLDLREADRKLPHAGLPQAVLDELSEAVDGFRSTLWAVLNSVSDDFSDPKTAPTLLTTHRIRRTGALLQALNLEMDTGRVTGATNGAPDLCNALGAAYKKLHYVVHRKPVPPEER